MNNKIKTSCADGLPIFSESHTVPFWAKVWNWMSWPISAIIDRIYMSKYPLTENNLETEKLAENIYRGIKRDLGDHVASYFELDPTKMIDEQLIQLSKIKPKEQTHCYECGQKLPEDR